VAYPPAAVHISEFQKVLEDEFGCEFKYETFPGIAGEFVRIERDMGNGKILEYPIDDYDPDMLVHGLLLMSACKVLMLDCSRWGLTLDPWYIDDDPDSMPS
jgi:hypothetical protein